MSGQEELNDFDLDSIEVDEEPAATFTLDGRKWSVRGRDSIDITVLDSAYSGGGVQVRKFFSTILVPSDVDDFNKLLDSGRGVLTLSRVEALMTFLAEEIVKRPTRRSAPSGGGSRKTKATSEGGSSSPGTRRGRLAS